MKTVSILSAVAGLTVSTAFATFAVGLDRMVLWQVVRACVADFKLTGTPFPCLEVDLSGVEERGNVVLRPPLLDDTVLAPTRKIVGIEDPFLQSPGAPNYFDAAWQARTFLKDAYGRVPEREEIALVVNSDAVGARTSSTSTWAASYPPLGSRLRPLRQRSPSADGRGSGRSFPIQRSGDCAFWAVTFRTSIRFGSPLRLLLARQRVRAT